MDTMTSSSNLELAGSHRSRLGEYETRHQLIFQKNVVGLEEFRVNSEVEYVGYPKKVSAT